MQRLLHILLFLFCSTTLLAQNDEFKASVSSSTVEIGENFRLVFDINGSASNFRPPVLSDNFKVLSGPNPYSEVRIVNGKISNKLSYNYVLQGFKTGTFVIEPGSVEIDGKPYQSNPIKIEIVQKKPASNNTQQNQTATTNNKGSDYFLAEAISKGSVYQGEQLLIAYTLNTAVDIENFDYNTMPDFRGFYTKDLEVDPLRERGRKNTNNRNYSTFPIKRTILIPQKSGDLEIDPMSIDMVVRVQDGQPINTIFGPRYRYKSEKITINSDPATIVVKPLPAGAPESFNGAVGRFAFSGGIDKKEVTVNEAININFQLKGTGNIQLVDVELPEMPSDFEVYDPEVNNAISYAGNVISGTRKWNVLMIPRTSGTFEIPAIKFSYFDPNKEEYFTETIGPFPLEVLKANGEAADNSGSTRYNPSQKEIQQVGSDIRYIHTGSVDLEEPDEYFFGSVLFYALLLLPFLLLGGGLIAVRRFDERAKDVVGSRKRKANKIAVRLLAEANTAREKGDKNAFFDATYKALYGYIGNKLSISVSELNKDRIQSVLTEHNVSPEVIQKLIETLNNCEMGRFAPVDVSLNQLYAQSEEIILKLEEQLKS